MEVKQNLSLRREKALSSSRMKLTVVVANRRDTLNIILNSRTNVQTEPAKSIESSLFFHCIVPVEIAKLKVSLSSR